MDLERELHQNWRTASVVKLSLRKKNLRLEWDLSTKEASCHNNAELRNELAKIRRANVELRRKKDSLQEENEEFQKKVKALEEKLKQKKDIKQDQHNTKDSSTYTTAQYDLKLLQVYASNLTFC